MRRVGSEPTISVFEQSKTMHALDHAATVIDRKRISFANTSALKGLILMAHSFAANTINNWNVTVFEEDVLPKNGKEYLLLSRT
jgi:hypothetical protein